MYRVLHYVGQMDRGGMETLIMNLYRNVDRTRIQFDFAVHGDRNGDFEQEILSLGGKFYHFPHMRKDPHAYKLAWRRFFEEHKGEFRAFHMHTNSLANIIALKEAAKAGIEIKIVHAHSSFANKGRLQLLNNILHKYHRNRLDRYADVLLACSDKAAQWLFGGMSLNGMNVIIIKNGITIEDFAVDEDKRKAKRAELGITDRKVIGHIGAFLPVKNHPFLVDSIEAAYSMDKNICCLLVGRGPEMEAIRTKVKEKDLSDVISFLGMREDVNELLMAMDLLVMPSKYEGLPVSLVEAQASGIPILASDTITRDVYFNPNFRYMSLDEGSKRWGEEIVDILNNAGRYEDTGNIRQAGFDIKDTAELYTKIIGG